MGKRLTDSESRLERWRSEVATALRTNWPIAVDVDVMAATIVGMFDAGARDREVAALLALHYESPAPGSEFLDLARHLHRLAAPRPSV